jgi:predicted site-specific integrase-resolvase
VATRTELLQAGVPASTIQSWLRAGHLQPAKRQGRYRLRAEAKRRLERYAAKERA